MEQKNKKIWIIGGIVLCLIAVIGVTFAFFSTGGSQEQANTFTSGCLNISLTDASSSINLSNTYPITDIEGLEGTSYDFTIENTCNTDTNYQINLESLNEVANSLSADYIKVSLSSDTVGNVISILSDNTQVTPEIDNAYESYNLYTGTLGASETKTYHLKLWLDYDATVEQAANKTYSSKINVIANPEIQVVDNLEATFLSGGLSVVINASSNKVNSINYCNTNDNICNPSKQAEITNNKSLIKIGNEKNITTSLGNLNVINTDKYLVCAQINDSSKIICSNPINTEIDFGKTIEEQDKNVCMYDSHYVYDLTTSKPSTNEENCQNVYFTGIPGMEYVDRTVEDAFSTFTYIPIGDWNEEEKLCTYNGNTVTDIIGNPITDKNRCKDIYTDGNDYLALTKIGSGVFAKSAGSTGLYEEKTQRGSTYYYRGNITNNYLVFAGFYWRIIRINEDGTIRIIYDGKQAYDNGELSVDRQIGISAYNTSYDRGEYVGYTYSEGYQRPNKGQSKETESTIKKELDTWYTNNLQLYDNYISNGIIAGFCNDRNVENEYIWNSQPNSVINYVAFERIYTNKQPTFECNDSNDLYTTKIGLITADEVMFAGGQYGLDSSNYYLYTGTSFWTMSPAGIDNRNTSIVFSVYENGFLITDFDTSYQLGVRPVINLRSDVTITGTGTIQDPYVVQTD